MRALGRWTIGSGPGAMGNRSSLGDPEDPTSGDFFNGQSNPMISRDLIRPWFDVEVFTDRHEPFIGDLGSSTLHENAPTGARRRIPVVDLEGGELFETRDVEFRTLARPEQNRSCNECVVDRQNHRLPPLIEAEATDLFGSQQFSALVGRKDVESLVVGREEWHP